VTSLDRGVFILSLDFELIWGTLDLFGTKGYAAACRAERAIIPRLLELLAAHRVSATWCVVGHLFLDRCGPWEGRPHPEVVRPRHAWQPADWLGQDPGGDEASQPLFFGRGLVEAVRACAAPQEIGAHSFSHVIYGDAGCSREAAESDLAACVSAARALGLELRSFAFPRNRVGHLDLLPRWGFTSFRGPGPRWYEREESPGWRARLAHLFDVVRAAAPPTVLPERSPEGLWNIPGSMIHFPMHGVRRLVPVSRRVARAVKGLDAAAREARIFHLWFHPTNLADRADAMLAGLDSILGHASRLRSQGRLEVLPMCELAARLA
jgi:peptidoglycan/xylan/chitin deacetylase (PgdA/CDA1 family)